MWYSDSLKCCSTPFYVHLCYIPGTIDSQWDFPWRDLWGRRQTKADFKLNNVNVLIFKKQLVTSLRWSKSLGGLKLAQSAHIWFSSSICFGIHNISYIEAEFQNSRIVDCGNSFCWNFMHLFSHLPNPRPIPMIGFQYYSSTRSDEKR
jgi:hypothetical protein